MFFKKGEVKIGLCFNKIIEILYLKQKNNLVFYDKLTQLLNRNWLEYHRTYLNNKQFYVIMIDLDNLKSVNDTKGHEAGDNLICGFATELKQYFPKDYIIRLGGDEFIIFSKHSPIDVIFELKQESKFDFSFGMSVKTPDVSLSKAMTKADTHMYCMKGWHKNLV